MVGAFLLMGVNPGTERKIYSELKKIKEISLVHEVYGEWDLIAKVDVQNVEDLDSLVSDKIRVLKDIKFTSTIIIAR